MDLKTKLAFALVTVSLLSMAVLGAFTYFWAEDTFVADARRQLEAAADRRKLEVLDVFDAWKTEARTFAEDLASGWPTANEEQLPAVGLAERIQMLSSQAKRQPHSDLLALALIDLDGQPIVGRPQIDPAPLFGAGVPETSFIGVRTQPDGTNAVVFHTSVVVNDSSAAVLEAVLSARALDRFFGPAPDLGETGRTIVVIATSPPEAGAAATTSHLQLLGTDESDATPRSAIDAVLRGEERSFDAEMNASELEVLAVTRFIAGPGVGLIAQIDSAEARLRADQLLFRMRRLAISLAAFAILSGTLFGLYLGGPIARLVEDVDRIRHGELGLRLEVKGEDEVAFLAQSLNEFMDQLNRSSDLFRVGHLPILVVCRDSKQRQLLADLLESWNMKPILADDSASALTVLEEARSENLIPQLLLVDESAPELDSPESIQRLRGAISSKVATIFLSMEPERFDEAMRERAGIGCVLPNPVIASHLMEAILDEMGVSAEAFAGAPDHLLPKTRPRSILLADDSALIQRVMVGLLENWGHDVTVADNGRIAVETYRKASFDLVLMDVEMPELNGLEAAREIRTIEREGGLRTPIIALTAETRSGDRDRCIEAGMDDYLSKPADPKALYALIERYPANAKG